MSSFIADKIVMDGLTFDDVLLIPAYSEVLPKTVELKTRFSRNIELNDGDREPDGYCHCPRGRHRRDPQEHVDREPGA